MNTFTLVTNLVIRYKYLFVHKHPSEIWASQPYADYDVEYGPGLKQASKPTLDSRGTTLTITAKNSGSGGKKVSDVYTAFDNYVTITGYYKKGNTVYKDTCRYHYIMADTKWWAHPEYIQNLSTNIGGK